MVAIKFIGNDLLPACKKLFSFAKARHLTGKTGQLLEDGMIWCHATDYFPTNGIIRTSRAKKVGSRDSIHGTINHYVTPHSGGNWDDRHFAILMPMGALRRTNVNRFFGGSATDFYSIGNIAIPEGSVIVRRIEGAPGSRYTIPDTSKIAKFKEMKGITVIETTAENMRTEVDKIIERLGYKLNSTENPYVWGKIEDGSGFKFFNLFKSFLTNNGMKCTHHTYTPDAGIEQIINFIFARAAAPPNMCSWIVKKNNFSYKNEFINFIKYFENFGKRKGLNINFDTQKLINIIRASKNPHEAMLRIKKEMNIKINPNDIVHYNNEKTFSIAFSKRVGQYGDRRKIDKMVFDYIDNPTYENLCKFDRSI